MALNIISKDWLEYRKPIALLTAGMFIPLIVSNRSSDFSKGMLAGILISASYSFAYSCFISERQRGTLQLLLSLPVEPFELVLAKYASLYSMALVTANLPAVFLGDLRLLFFLNAFVLLFSTICMAGTVVSEKPWAPMVPLWIVLVFFMPVQKILARFYPDGLGLYHLMASHAMLLAAVAIGLAPLIAILSAVWFEWRQSA
ncbi:MAG: hypothetical protein DMG13_09325 [Acidobacteria bacterium]|nr:MAG: hypothetical protein DMG13_09325 [Acidobacteriota bacterium]